MTGVGCVVEANQRSCHSNRDGDLNCNDVNVVLSVQLAAAVSK